MKETVATLVSDIRLELGDPLDTEISTESLEQSLRKAVREYSRYRPREVYGTLNLVSDVSKYPIETEDLLFVEEVYFCTMHQWRMMSNDLDHLYEGNRLPDISRLSNPSLLTVFYQKMESLSQEMSRDWRSDSTGITIIPTPTSEGFAVYKGCYLHTPITAGESTTYPTIMEGDRDLILLYAIGHAMIKLGRKRNKKITKVPTISGSITFDDGVTWREGGHLLIEEFKGSLGQNASVVVMG